MSIALTYWEQQMEHMLKSINSMKKQILEIWLYFLVSALSWNTTLGEYVFIPQHEISEYCTSWGKRFLYIAGLKPAQEFDSQEHDTHQLLD